MRTKKKYLWMGAAVLAALAAGAILLALTRQGRSISPDGAYEAFYNRLSNLVIVQKRGEDTHWRSVNQGNGTPAFVWSLDSRLLAVNYGTGAEIFHPGASNSRNVPVPPSLGEAGTPVVSRMEVAAFLDSGHAAVTFSYAPDERGGESRGWYIYEYASGSMLNLTVESVD